MLSQGDLPDDADARLQECERIIDYRFADAELLQAALTHASSAPHRLGSNERLEFLGDAVLGIIVCEALFEQHPNYLEGELTKIKSVVVSRTICAKISRQLGLQEVLFVGRGIATNRTVPSSLLADVFESLVAAIYLDGGFDEARRFVLRLVQPEIDAATDGALDYNYKSTLQHLVQRDFGDTPTYTLQGEHGPDHNKQFQVAARFNGRDFFPAWGRNKKEAEQRAAANALAELQDQELPFPHKLPSIHP